MSKVYESTNISIVKKNKNYVLEFKNMHEKPVTVLYNSLNLQSNDFIDTESKCRKNKSCTVTFNAIKVTPLKQMISNLSYKELVFLFLSLKNQLTYLHKHKLGILYFNINDIVVIHTSDSLFFMFLNTNNIYPINDDFLQISQSFNKKNPSSFIPPELYSFNSIPFNIHYKVSFFSLAHLIGFMINGKRVNFTDTTDWDTRDFEKLCESIDNTKLFWALLRCQQINPANRYLLWI